MLNVAGGLSGYMFTVVARFKKLPAFSPVEVRAENRAKKGPWTEYGPPAEKYRTAAGQFLLQDAQAVLLEKQMESLVVDKKLQAEEGFPERTIVTVGAAKRSISGSRTTWTSYQCCPRTTSWRDSTCKKPTSWIMPEWTP